MRAIRVTIAPMASRSDTSGRPKRSTSQWNSACAMKRTASTSSTFKFRQFLADTISRPTTAASTKRNDRSTIAVSQGPRWADTIVATRPATHSENRPASGQPTTGRRPVQLGTAVRRNPAMTAGT
jgi:hypothetical protein